MNKDSILICPVCKNKLMFYEKTLKCENNHSFDYAKEHYVNLYHNKGINAGDDKQMLKARHDVLDKGYYVGVSNQLNELIRTFLSPNNKEINIIDAGCGEGYYLSNLQNVLKDRFDHLHCYGFDISKEGIKIAGKRNKDIHWFVANANDIPIKDLSIDCFINMFSFYNEKEIHRTLKKDGMAIIFRAGDKHLIELKAILYDELIPKEHQVIFDQLLFNVQKENLNYSIIIDSSTDIEKVLLMTPHYWKSKQENKDALKSYQRITVTIDIDIYILTKRNG